MAVTGRVHVSLLNAASQHIHHAAFAHFTLQPRQKLAPRHAVVTKVESFDHLRLSGTQERCELNQIHAVPAAIIGRIAGEPTLTAVGRRRLSYNRRGTGRPGKELAAGECTVLGCR